MFGLNASIIIRMKVNKCLNTTVYNYALLRVLIIGMSKVGEDCSSLPALYKFTTVQEPDTSTPPSHI